MSSSTASSVCCQPQAESYCQVALDLGDLGPDHPFDYFIPEELRGMVKPGMRVRVPLGSREATGVVLGLSDLPRCSFQDVKPVISAVDERPLLGWDCLEVAEEISRRNGCSLASMLSCALPPAVRGGMTRPKRTGLREYLAANREESAGVPELTPEQAQAVSVIRRLMEAKSPRVVLLFGVTGSGKTEVYVRCAEHALSQGRGALIMVPEIALTFQLVSRFKARLGVDVAVIHSRLGDTQRALEWRRVLDGSARVVIGARSASLAPLPSIGLIVLDEEHDDSYRQDASPRYHARDVAVARATRHGAVVVLGSATPSVGSFYRALEGSYQLLTLKERAGGRALPGVSVVDMRREASRGGRPVLSAFLVDRMREHLSRGEQVVLFQNRRGYSTFLLCRECGHVIKCPSCNVTLTLHKAPRGLFCHHCGHRAPVPDRCPQCKGREIKAYGAGTERVEEAVNRLFPDRSSARLDLDAARNLSSCRDILGAFAEGRTAILVGTQMVAKGHDVKGVGLVGVVSADSSLHLPDFRAAERTFQLLSQVAGRAGRGDAVGEAVIQTYNPEHYSIRCAASYDSESFYERELQVRRELGYPPFTLLVKVVFSASREAAAQQASSCFAEWYRRLAEPGSYYSLAGPAPAPLSRVRGWYRYVVAVKAPVDVPAETLVRTCREACSASFKECGRGGNLRIAVDVDPADML